MSFSSPDACHVCVSPKTIPSGIRLYLLRPATMLRLRSLHGHFSPRPSRRLRSAEAVHAALASGSIAERFFSLTLFMARSIGRTVNSFRSSRKLSSSGDSWREIKPERDLVVGKRERHPVVIGGDELIRLLGQDCERGPFVALVFRFLPDAREHQRLAVLAGEIIRLLAAFIPPFVESVGGNDATLLA